MSISLPFATLISYFIYLISPTLINQNLETKVLEAISNDNYQFIEIYNNTNQSVDITGVRFRTQTISVPDDEEDDPGRQIYTRYQFGCPMGCRYCDDPETTVIQSYQFMVIADQDSYYSGIN